MDITKLIKPNIRTLRAYHAEETPCRVKLDANESPHSVVSGQLSALSFKEHLLTLNRYPDPQATSLRKLIAKDIGVKSVNVLHGNGSDELIYYLIMTFGGPVLYPVPTFSMYGVISQALGEMRIGIPLDNKFDLDTDAFITTIKKRGPRLIFLSSPNNPTGNCFSEDRILKIIKAASSPVARHPSLVVVDEAYQPFSEKRSFIPLMKKYENLVILRTLSKIGLAALRVGFMTAGTDIIDEVNKVRLPFNVNALSQKLAAEALLNRRQMRSNIRLVISERKRLFKELVRMDGVEPYPSDANFIFFKVIDGDRVHKGLLSKGVLIRNLTGVAEGCLRVTVGTPAENTAFLNALKQIL